MRRWNPAPKHQSRIEIIPMIDVMMFLLVFFVLISVNVIPALGIKTQQPQSSQAQPLKTPSKQVVVTLGKDGQVMVDGKAVRVDLLTASVRALAGPAEAVAVIVNSDKGAEVQLLVDVMDALKRGGIGSVSLAARERH